MGEKTINGFTKAEIIKRLTADFPADKIGHDPDGFPYFPVYLYGERLDEAVGALNYNFSTTPHTVEIVGGIPYVSLQGALTLLYDDGTEVCTRVAPGGAPVIIVNATGKPKDLSNDIKSAASDAFKACCKRFGIGENQIRNAKKNKRKNNDGSTAGGSKEQTSEAYRVKITGKFASLNGKGYKAPAIIIDKNEPVSLVLWENAVKKIEEKMKIADFCEKYVNQTLSVMATKNTYHAKGGDETQLTVVDFAKKN